MRSRLGVLLVVGLLWGFVAACGSEPDQPTAETLFPRVSKAVLKSGSSHIAMTLTAPSGEKFTSRGQMKLGKRPQDTAMAMTVDAGTGSLGTVEMRLVDRTFYISLGALTKNKFAKVDLADKSNPISSQYGAILENLDPARELQQYEKAITKFDASGETVEIDGVKAQPFRFSVDPSKADQFKQLDRAAIPASINVTLYVGPDDLPRRIVMQMPTQNGTTKQQRDYSKWGENVTITAPSKSRITEDSLLDDIGQSGSARATPATP